MLLKRIIFSASAAAVALVATGCDDPFQLTPAFDANFIDTITVYALQGTPIDRPSAYDVTTRTLARTDRAEQWDFAFDLGADAVGTAEVFPTGALGLGEQSGMLISDREFDDIDEAPSEGFTLDSALAVDLETVFVVRSRPSTLSCPFFIGALPRYGKFRVLAIDRVERALTLEALVNINCGYRGLEVGLPTR